MESGQGALKQRAFDGDALPIFVIGRALFFALARTTLLLRRRLRLRIFISYSSKYRDVCERLQLALEAGGRHEVFVDRAELAPGQPFDTKIRQALLNCDLLLFLISPESVAHGSYALAELEIAKTRWRHPGGHVLPVEVAPTDLQAIPAYLRAVTILQPSGEVVAETVAAVEAVRPPPRRARLWALLAAALALAGTLAGASYLQTRQQRAEEARAATLASAARELCVSGDHALAWRRYDEAITKFPARPALLRGREDCGMRWLRDIRVQAGGDTFTDIVNKVLPVLAEGAASAGGQRGADLRAHMGWADFLRGRDGAGGTNPQAHYERALALEPSNVYAHAMWGHHIMVQSEPVDGAKQHFAAALASNRERAYVRNRQFAAMLYYRTRPGQLEAVRVAGEMRSRGEMVDLNSRERLWTYLYYDGLLAGNGREAFMAEMRDGGHAATFAWLYPPNEVRADRKALWRFFMASLEEAAGDRNAARPRYESLRDDLQREHASGRLLDETLAAIERLRARGGGDRGGRS
jgi:tetratricopeptide (TPR) repeat protein